MRDPDAYLVARLRFKHLALVEALGRLHSIRKAARAIHVSEPAVSKALAEIEASFGYVLFERSSAGVVPTARGEEVIQGARLLLNSLRHVRLAAESAERRLSLRLGANPFVAQTFLPRLFSALRERTDNLRIELREGAGPQLLQQLRDGEIDAMLIAMTLEDVGSQHGQDLAIRPLYTEALAIIAPKSHRLARKRSVAWGDVAGERWILPPGPAMVEATIRNAFLSQGLVPPKPWIDSAAPSTNVGLVADGLGLSAVPLPYARAVRGAAAVEILQVRPQALLPPVSLIHRCDLAETPIIRALAMALDDALAA